MMMRKPNRKRDDELGRLRRDSPATLRTLWTLLMRFGEVEELAEEASDKILLWQRAFWFQGACT